MVKRATDAAGVARNTVYIFDSLELRQADFTGGEYEDSESSERLYLSAHGVRLGRVDLEPTASPIVGSGAMHVFLELQDHLGSTSLVVDKATGELVEAAGYLGSGARESDYRPGRWQGAREEYGFTGKEEDVEVGLTYFGKRFLSPCLGRWVSPDPLAVHVPGKGDLNLYAYVHGAILKAIDPVGLDPGAPAKGGAPDGETANAAAAQDASEKVLNAGQFAGAVCAGPDQNMSCGPTGWEAETNSTSNFLVAAANKDHRDRQDSRRTAQHDHALKEADFVPGNMDSVLPLSASDLAGGAVTSVGKATARLGGRLVLRIGPKAAPAAAAKGGDLLFGEAEKAVAHLSADPANVLARLSTKEAAVYRRALLGDPKALRLKGALERKAVEREVASGIDADATLSSLFEWTRGRTPGPDFVGKGDLAGRVYDITTYRQVGSKFIKDGAGGWVPKYGAGQVIVPYEWPQP